ncbi:MAG: S8 family peptidase [Alloprevotella sp.]|nr:S8 family peptidase [Alloprevotella sp.]
MMRKSLLTGFFAIVSSVALNAQLPLDYNQPKFDRSVENFINKGEKVVSHVDGKVRLSVKKVESTDETMNVTINAANAERLVKQLTRKGYTALLISENVLVAELPAGELKSLADNKEVFYVKKPRQFYPNMKVTRNATSADLVHKGQDLETPFDGTGVVIGVIDQGFQYKHAAFLDEDGVSRIVRVLNHSASTNYLRQQPSTSIPNRDDGFAGSHATHVTNIAAGSKLDGVDFYGIAPKADLYIVPSNFYDDAIQAAVKYIKDFAVAEGKPCVINMSFGATVGPHDGTTLYDRTIDGYIQSGGVFVAAAMGNERGEKIHATHTFTADNQTRYLKVSSFDNDYYLGEVWCTSVANGTKPLTITPVYFSGNTPHEFSSSQLSTVETYNEDGVDAYNRKQYYYFQVPYSAVSSASTSSNLFFGLKITGNTGDTFHAWTSNNYSAFEAPSSTTIVKGDDKYIVGEGAASIPSAFAVASYNATNSYTNTKGESYRYSVGNVNEIANYSSRGPWLGSQPKPIVAAPGSVILSAKDRYDSGLDKTTHVAATYGSGSNTDYYGPMSGTSMATPVVTGSIALWLQANPDLTYDQIVEIFKETSTRDSKTGTASATENDPDWGFGKLNVYKGLQKALQYRTNSGNEPAFNSDSPVSTYIDDDALRVLFNNGESFANIRVYTPSGKLVESRSLNNLQAGNEEVLSYYNFEPGIYVVNIQTTRGNVTRKILVK